MKSNYPANSKMVQFLNHVLRRARRVELFKLWMSDAQAKLAAKKVEHAENYGMPANEIAEQIK